MNDLFKIVGTAAGGMAMIVCCAAPFVVIGAISGLWAWLSGLDPMLGAGIALGVATLAYGLIGGRRRAATTRRWSYEGARSSSSVSKKGLNL